MKVMSAIESCPHGGSRRPRCALRGLRAHDHRIQLLPQPALPKVPGRGRTAVARRARGRAVARAVLPCGVHAAGQDRRHRLSEQGRDLRPAVQGIRRDADHDCGRPKYLGARIGITTVLHTWGSAMTHHPHVHMIVPGGGISLDGERWVSCRPSYLLPVPVLSRLFRRLFLEKLTAAHHAGRLQFFGQHVALAQRKAFATYLAPLRKVEWYLYTKRPFGGPEAVLAYLSRYTHRHRHLQQPADRVRRRWRRVQIQRLSRRRPRAEQGHDARHNRVHPPLPRPRAATRLPPHP